MLFAISGSQGSGKSTVIQKLSELGYPTVERKTSRSILDEWKVTLSQVNNNRELTIKFQEEILKRKIQDEEEAGSDVSRIWFTERTYADLFTYALIAVGKDNEYSDWLNSYFARCQQAQTIYSHNFYLKSGVFPAVADGVRGVNKHYVRLVEVTMLDVLDEFNHGTGSIDPATFVREGASFYTLIKDAEIEFRVSKILQNISSHSPWATVEHSFFQRREKEDNDK